MLNNPRPLLCLLLFHAAAAGAQDTIVVTGRSLPQPPGSATASTVVIDSERLQSTASGRIEDALRDVASFQQFRRTDSRAANPTSQGVTLRGLGGNAASRALVTLDGVPIADPFGGWISWTAIDPAELEAIRVTLGGGSAAFGAGALTGVIELASAGRDAQPSLRAAISYGSRESWDLRTGGLRRLGQGYTGGSLGYARGDGYILLSEAQRGPVDVPADYEQWYFNRRVVLPVNTDTELQARIGIASDERLRGIEGTESKTQSADASVRLVGRGPLPWEALAYVQARNFESGFVAVNADRTQATPTLDQFNTPATGWGAKVELRPVADDRQSLRLGADVRGGDGETHERFRFVNGEFTRLRTAGGTQAVGGAFVDYALVAAPALTVTGTARIDRWTIRDGAVREVELGTGVATLAQSFADRDGWEPSVRLGAGWDATPALTLTGAAYTGWRLPTLNELYRPFRVGADATAANAELRPETLEGVEAGIRFRPLGHLDLAARLFWNRLEDAVANVTLARGPGVFPGVGFVAAGGAYRQRQNVDAIRAQGLEFDGSVRLGVADLRASYAFTDAVVRASGAAAALDGQRPAQVPRHRLSATVGAEPTARTALSATLRYESSQFEDDLGERRLDDWLTVDATARVTLADGLALVARAENLFDATVQAGISSTGIVDRASPRTLWLGLTARLD